MTALSNISGYIAVTAAQVPTAIAARPHSAYGLLGLLFLALMVMIPVMVLLNRRLRQAEPALTESNDRLRQLDAHGGIVLWEFDINGMYTYVAPSCEAVFGYTPEELVGKKHYYDIFPENLRESLTAEIQACIEVDGESQRFENQIERKDGRIITVVTSALPIFGPDGTRIGYRGIDSEVTERVEAEARLEASERQLRYAMQASADGLWDWNLLTNEIALSPRVYEMIGYPPGAFPVTGESWLEYLHPDDRESTLAATNDALQSTEAEPVSIAEYRLRRADGSYCWVLGRGQLVERTPDGAPKRMVGTLVDIDARKRAEQALAESEARFRTVFDLGLIGMVIARDDRTIKSCNARFAEIVGRPVDALIGMDWASFTHPEDLAWEGKAHDAMNAGGQASMSGTKRYLRPDGTVVIVQLSAVGTPDADGTVREVYALVEDVTAREEARAELEQRDALFANLHENVPGAIYQFRIAPDGTASFPYVSDGAEEIFGSVGLGTVWSAEIMFGAVHPDDIEALHFSIMESMQTLAVWSTECRIITQTGEIRWIQGRSRPQRDPDGGTTWYGYLSDITKEKAAELEAVANEQRMTRQREALARLAISPAIAAGDIEAGLREITEAATEALEVERALFLEINEDQRACVCLDLFESPTQQHSAGSVFDIREHTQYLVRMQRERQIVIHDARQDESMASFTLGYLDPLDVSACLDTGVYFEDRMVGIVSFEATGSARTWRRDEEIFAATIAAITSQLLANAARKEATAALRETLTRYDHLVAPVPVGAYVLQSDANGEMAMEYVSDRWCEIHQVSHEDVLADIATANDLVHPDDREAFLARNQRSFQERIPFAWEGRFILHDGTLKWLRIQSTPVFESNGDARWYGVTSDITSLKTAELEAVANEQRMTRQREALARLAISPAIAAGDLEAGLREITEAAAEALEVERAMFLRMRTDETALVCLDLFERSRQQHSAGHLLDAIQHADYVARMQHEGQVVASDARNDPTMASLAPGWLEPLGVYSFLDTVVRIEGHLAGVVSFEATGAPRAWQRDEAIFATTIAAVTGQLLANAARKEATAALRESEELFRTFVESVPAVAIQGYELDGTVTHWNHASEALYGYTAEEAIGGNLLDLIIPDEMREEVKQGLLNAREGGHEMPPEELTLRHKDGHPVQVHSSHALVHREGRATQLFCIDVDISERIRAEEALRERDRLLERLSENIPGFIYQYRMWPDGRACFPYASRGIEDIYGVTAEEASQTAEKVFGFLHPDDRERVQATIMESFENLSLWRTQFRVNMANRGVRWLFGQARPEKMPDGSVLWHGYNYDQTEEVAAAEDHQRLERQIEKTQRLESLGVMAGGIAHDFNNILMAVLANAEIAQQTLPADADAHIPMTEIQVAAQRAAELCRQMLAYAGQSSLVTSQFDLAALVEETSHLVRATIPKKVALELALEPNPPAITGDASQIRQVVMNLMINGAEAIGEDEGTVSVRLRGHALTEAMPEGNNGFNDALPAGDYCLLEVQDSGSGMSSETLGRIFEPFFTTKFTGRGLGLAAVLGIVRAHDGALAVQTEKGMGTTFRVLLPAVAVSATTDTPAPEDLPPLAWSGGVLLVDDEAPLRAVGRRMLERIGCTVWTAEDGCEALELHAQHGESIDLVILDLMMPHMDGAEALRQLRARDAALPVILASGYSHEALAERFHGQTITGFLQKPYGYKALETALRAFAARVGA